MFSLSFLRTQEFVGGGGVFLIEEMVVCCVEHCESEGCEGGAEG